MNRWGNGSEKICQDSTQRVCIWDVHHPTHAVDRKLIPVNAGGVVARVKPANDAIELSECAEIRNAGSLLTQCRGFHRRSAVTREDTQQARTQEAREASIA